MHILVITTSLRIKSGPNNVIRSLCNHWLDKSDNKVTLLSLKAYSTEERSRYSNVDDVRTLNYKNISSVIDDVNKIKDLVAEIKPDVINSHGFIPDLYSKLIGFVNTVSVIHNNPVQDYKFTYGFIKGIIFSKLHLYIIRKNNNVFVSKEGYETYKGLLDKTYYIPNGVSDKYINNCRKKTNKTRIVFCGHLEERKDPTTFLKACDKLRETHGIEVDILGEGTLKSKLQDKHSSFNFRGFVNNVPEYLNSADLFVMSSRAEGMPMALLESLSCNTSVVVSDIPPLKILVDNYNIGRSFEVGNSEDCCEKMKFVIDNSESFTPRDIYLKYFTSTVVGESYLNLFKEIMSVTRNLK